MANLTLFTFSAFLAVIIANPVLNFNESKLETRIVGGFKAGEGQFPYLVSIQDPKHEHLCVGSILNEDWILTAASCMLGKKTDDMFIVVGTSDISDTKSGVSHRVGKYIPHKELNASRGNDIALIKTMTKIKFSRNVQPIKLAESDLNVALLPVVVPGWDIMSSIGEKKLQYIIGNILYHEFCVKMVAIELPKFPPVNDNQICIGSEFTEVSVEGDAGAPVVTTVGVLIGLSSMEYSKEKRTLLLSTHVWKYVNWIDDTIKENTLVSITNSTIKSKSSIELITALTLFIVHCYKW